MNKDIVAHFQQIKDLIAQGRGKALQAANAYSLMTYWHIGAYLSSQLSEKTFGKKIVVQLADWLKQQEPTLKGFDRRNLYRMRSFYDIWEKMDWSLLPPKFQENQIIMDDSSNEKTEGKFVVLTTPQLKPLPDVLTRITWTHHIEILRGATSPEEMLFYLILTIKDHYKDVKKPHENPSIVVYCCVRQKTMKWSKLR